MIKGAAVLFIEQILKKGVLFLATFALAYFLPPADFGLISIAVYVLGFSNSFVESGLKDSIIREKGLTEITLSTAYWINNAFAAVVFLSVISMSSFIADIYDQEKLTEILPVIALTSILFSQQVVPLGIIHRQLEFSKVVKATLPAVLISSIISIFLAYAGYGIWALIFQILLSTSITSVILFRESKFRPTFKFDRSAAVNLLSFGAPLFLANIVSTTSKNLLFLIPGKILGMTVSGFIYMADKIMETIMSQIVYSVQQASYPVLANYAHDPKELKARYREILSITSTGVTTILGLVFVTASSVTSIFFSEQWNGLDIYVMSLSVAYCLYPIHSLNLNILKTMGKTKQYFYLDIYKLALSALVITATAGISVKALLTGIIFLSIANLIPNGYYTSKLIGYDYGEQVGDFMRSSAIPITASVSVYLITIILFPAGFSAFAFSLVVYVILVAIGFHLTKNQLLLKLLKTVKR